MYKKLFATAILACSASLAHSAVLVFNNIGDTTPIVNHYQGQADATFTTFGNVDLTYQGNGRVFIPGNNNFPEFDATRAGFDYIFTSFSQEPTSITYFGVPVTNDQANTLLFQSFTGNVGTTEISYNNIPGQDLELILALLPNYRWEQAFPQPGNPVTGEPVTGEVPLPGTAYLLGIGAIALVGRKKITKA